jgi:hypothetical protein
MRLAFAALLALTALPGLALPSTARADAIDGAWCHIDGRRIVIAGPSVTTPAGSQIKGDYGRHSFTYTVPKPDPGAGTEVRMQLMGEYHVQVQEGPATPVVWDRCGPSISAMPVRRRFG